MPESPVSNRLDSPPPAPAGMVRRVPDSAAPAAPMMGGGGGGIAQNTLPSAIIERAMLADQAIASIGEIFPQLLPQMAAISDQLKAAISGALQSGGSAPQSAPPGMAGIMAGGA